MCLARAAGCDSRQAASTVRPSLILCSAPPCVWQWGIALNTLGIMLGWAVHGFYAGLEHDAIPQAAQHPAATLLLAAAVTSIAVCSVFATVTGRRAA